MDIVKCNTLLKHQSDQIKRLINADYKANELIWLCKAKITENTFDWSIKDWKSAILTLLSYRIVGVNVEYTICIIERAAAQLFSIYSK